MHLPCLFTDDAASPAALIIPTPTSAYAAFEIALSCPLDKNFKRISGNYGNLECEKMFRN